jgi:two-component sensor histidine kinase
LTVSDDGVGFPKGRDFFGPSSSLGLQLVQILAGQLKAEVTMTRAPGTSVELAFDVTD